MGRWIMVWTLVSFVMAGFAMNSLPDSKRFISKPIWSLLECDEATFQKQLQVLDHVAPDFHSITTYDALVEALREYGDFNLDARALYQAGITSQSEIVAKRLSSQETIGQMLVRILNDTDCLTIKVCESSILITSCEMASTRMNRIYPCPAMHSEFVLNSISATIPGNWESDGGDDSLLIVDTDNQSLIVVSAPYKVHIEVEKLLRRLNKAAGIGWRSDKPSWSRISDKVCERLGRWIVSGASQGTSGGGAFPNGNNNNSGMVRGMGCMGGGMF